MTMGNAYSEFATLLSLAALVGVIAPLSFSEVNFTEHQKTSALL